MTLTLYNTLTRKKEPFRPIDPSNVRMYVCGPTVYDFAHIGNARPVIVFDVLFRLLRHLYGAEHVTYARNITDVDDKINARAAEEYPDLPLNEAIRQVTEKTERQFHEDIAALGVLPPTVEPRATEHIEEMKALCEVLVAKGHAYVADGHVLFDVASMPDYGRLANRSLEEMEAGARVEVAPYKKGPMDFVLWKPSKPGEPAWPSPAGINAAGRPGWHLECSAMSDRWLWQEPQMRGLLSEAGLKQPHVFDIHGGGIDLVFPHHENEIAQSRCAHGTPAMANVWMHNGFLQVEGEKMSKSLGNFVTIHELLRGWAGRPWSGPVLRLAMLRTHYRQPINWTATSLVEARRELGEWVLALLSLRGAQNLSQLSVESKPDTKLEESLKDDLNTPASLAVLREQYLGAAKGEPDAGRRLAGNLQFLGLLSVPLMRAYVQGVSSEGSLSTQTLFANVDLGEKLKVALLNGDEVFANELKAELGRRNLRAVVNAGGVTLTLIDETKVEADTIGEMIEARNTARKAKNFKEADEIRQRLADMGIQLKDSKDPATGEIVTTWEVKR